MKNYLHQLGYKQEGKVYIPPIFQLGEFSGVYWLDDVLPEIIWIAILQNKFGLGLGKELALQISGSTNELLSINGHKKWLAPLSCYSDLSNDDKSKLIEKVNKLGYDRYFNSAFGFFAEIYPEFPLAFLMSEKTQSDTQESLKEYKSFLSDLYYKTNKAAIFMQATAIDMAFQADILTVSPNTSLAKFPEIINYPDTEISIKVASAICAAINGYFSNTMLFKSTGNWKSYFWNRGLQIEKCY